MVPGCKHSVVLRKNVPRKVQCLQTDTPTQQPRCGVGVFYKGERYTLPTDEFTLVTYRCFRVIVRKTARCFSAVREAWR